jgi:hypothetical protein
MSVLNAAPASYSKSRLHEEEQEIERAIKVRKDELRGYIDADAKIAMHHFGSPLTYNNFGWLLMFFSLFVLSLSWYSLFHVPVVSLPSHYCLDVRSIHSKHGQDIVENTCLWPPPYSTPHPSSPPIFGRIRVFYDSRTVTNTTTIPLRAGITTYGLVRRKQ